MSREYITGEREKQRSYSRAVKVKGGTTVYLAGVGGRRGLRAAPSTLQVRRVMPSVASGRTLPMLEANLTILPP